MARIMRSRSDLNQAGIVRELRRLGAYVLVVSTKAIGCDLLVNFDGSLYMVEVKQPGHKDDLTEHEEEVKQMFWPHYLVIESVYDFYEQVNL